MNDGSAGLVLREDDGGAAILTLNRPEKRNALNVELFVELEAHLADVEGAIDSVGVVVLRAAGSCFSAGADVSKPTRAPRRHFQASVIERLAHLPQPVIAVVQGPCLTGGLELALAADLIIAGKSARFADTHARFGLSAAWGMSQRLPRRVGPAKAREMMFTAREYSGAEAQTMGLANACVPDSDVDSALRTLLSEMLALSWFSNREHKKMLLATDGMSLTEGLAYEAYRGGLAAPDFLDRIGGRFGS